LVQLEGEGTDAEVFHYQLDHLGTPLALTLDTGATAWQVRYRAYGNVWREEIAEVATPLRFQGQYFDAETGLHYNRHRYYQPETGRFITPDPIGLAGGLNNYQYAPNPTGWVDPLGLSNKPGDCPPPKTAEAGPAQPKRQGGPEEPPRNSSHIHHKSFEAAMNDALSWLEARGFKAEQVNTGKFNEIRNKPVGMTTANGKTGFRVEYDEDAKAHINVFNGKEKGPHYLFPSTPEIVLKLQKLFDHPSKPRIER
ncbi:RHS repeat-associated core domain-containing protein, partial [Aeromonas popoffii]|uniref:RHS repeat-associated core domain-containing protein n=1 Tax=Aeromonas popoffii TaxID=70856 RepID=UPI0020118BB7